MLGTKDMTKKTRKKPICFHGAYLLMGKRWIIHKIGERHMVIYIYETKQVCACVCMCAQAYESPLEDNSLKKPPCELRPGYVRGE